MSKKSSEEHTPGIPCPKCGFFIEMSIRSLLYQPSFQCPQCLLTLTMDRSSSTNALDLLQKVNKEMENLEKYKHFDL